MFERKNHSAVGVRGDHYYEGYYAKFKQHYTSNNFASLAKMLSVGRADFSIGYKNIDRVAMARTGIELFVCGQKPLANITLYSYIHSDFSWAILAIESACQKAFGQRYEWLEVDIAQ